MTTRLPSPVGWPIVVLTWGMALLAAACSEGRNGLATAEAPATIVASGATTPTVALNPVDGRRYVAWVGSDNGTYNVYLAAAERGSTTFSAPRRVNDIPGDAAPHEQAPAQVAVGPAGELYVIWQNNTVIEGRRFPASDLRLAVSTDHGESFAPAVTVNDDAGTVPSSHTFHNLTVADDGTLFVSWIDSRVQDRAELDAADSTPETVAASAGPEIRVSSSSDRGRTFTPSVVVDMNSCPCCRTSIAVGPDGTVYVAWRKLFPGDVRDIVVAAATPGTLDFGDPVRVHADDWVFPGCPHAGPSIALDELGRLHVGWYTGKEERQGLWYAVSDDRGRSFGPPEPLVAGEWVPPSQVALTRFGSGVIAAWEDRSGEGGSVVLGRPGDGHAPPLLESGRGPSVAGNRTGAFFVWLDGEAIRGRWAKNPNAESPLTAN
jgi:hypothetical protein